MIHFQKRNIGCLIVWYLSWWSICILFCCLIIGMKWKRLPPKEVQILTIWPIQSCSSYQKNQPNNPSFSEVGVFQLSGICSIIIRLENESYHLYYLYCLALAVWVVHIYTSQTWEQKCTEKNDTYFFLENHAIKGCSTLDSPNKNNPLNICTIYHPINPVYIPTIFPIYPHITTPLGKKTWWLAPKKCFMLL